MNATTTQAHDFIDEYNGRIVQLIDALIAKNQTNNQLSVYEEENIAKVAYIGKILTWLYYILAIYGIFLIWTGMGDLGIFKRIIYSLLVIIYPSIVMPLSKWLIRQASWLWGLMPYHVNYYIKPV